MSQRYESGKDEGCIFTESCSKGQEFCEDFQIGYEMCSPNHMNKAVCTSMSIFMNKCNMVRSKEETLCILNYPDKKKKGLTEIYGPHSRCFEWRRVKDDSLFRYAECNLAKVSILKL